MNNKVLIFSVVFFATLTLGSALQCYICSGSKHSDCAQGKTSAMVTKNCKSPQLPIFYYGLHSSLSTIRGGFPADDGPKVYCVSVMAKDFSPKLFERSCGLFPGGVDPCDYLIKSGQFEDCKACSSDKCNKGEDYEDNYHTVNQF